MQVRGNPKKTKKKTQFYLLFKKKKMKRDTNTHKRRLRFLFFYSHIAEYLVLLTWAQRLRERVGLLPFEIHSQFKIGLHQASRVRQRCTCAQYWQAMAALVHASPVLRSDVFIVHMTNAQTCAGARGLTPPCKRGLLRNNLALEWFVCIMPCITLRLWNSVTDLMENCAAGWLSWVGVGGERLEERGNVVGARGGVEERVTRYKLGSFFSPRGNVIIGDNIEIRDVILMTIRARGYMVGTVVGRKNRRHVSAITNGVTIRFTTVRNTPQV